MENSQQIPTILVVDDSLINLTVASKMLELSGLKVLKATGGMEAFGLLQKEPGISMVLMDLEMPTIDGYTTTQLIRNSGEPFARVLIAALSGSDDAPTKEKALKAGMDFYLTKPISAAAVLECLASRPTVQDSVADTGEYNLEYLRMVSGEDPAMLNELSSHILEDAPLILEEAINAAKSEDWELTANHLHKAKSQLKIFGTDRLVERVIELELRAKSEDMDKTNLFTDLSHVLNETQRIFLLISEELNLHK